LFIKNRQLTLVKLSRYTCKFLKSVRITKNY